LGADTQPSIFNRCMPRPSVDYPERRLRQKGTLMLIALSCMTVWYAVLFPDERWIRAVQERIEVHAQRGVIECDRFAPESLGKWQPGAPRIVVDR
jgi:hypothetical protein